MKNMEDYYLFEHVHESASHITIALCGYDLHNFTWYMFITHGNDRPDDICSLGPHEWQSNMAEYYLFDHVHESAIHITIALCGYVVLIYTILLGCMFIPMATLDPMIFWSP